MSKYTNYEVPLTGSVGEQKNVHSESNGTDTGIGTDTDASANKVIRSLLILIAMEQEAADFIQHFGLVEQQIVQFPLSQIPSKQYYKRYNKSISSNDDSDEWIDIYVVTNGRDERFDCNNVSSYIMYIVDVYLID